MLAVAWPCDHRVSPGVLVLSRHPRVAIISGPCADRLDGDSQLAQRGRVAADTAGLDLEALGQLLGGHQAAVLQYLKQHNDRPVSREELLAEVWGYAKTARLETRTVDIHMAKLRRKIEPNPIEPQFLVTVRGEGYKLSA